MALLCGHLELQKTMPIRMRGQGSLIKIRCHEWQRLLAAHFPHPGYTANLLSHTAFHLGVTILDDGPEQKSCAPH